MPETIEFPLNDGMYLKKAEEYLAVDDYSQALATIKNVKEKTPQISYLHALILFYLEEYEEALDIAEVHKDFYLSTEEYAISYTMLLIKNRLFIEAEALILQHLQENVVDTLLHSNWALLQQELEEERTIYNEQVEKLKNKIQSGLLEIESVAPSTQSILIRDSHVLDLTDLQQVAQQIFDSYHLSPLNQRAFLEVLIVKMDDQEYTFNWFNQRRKVKPIELNTFEASPILSQLDERLKNKLEKSPSLIESLQLEILNDALMLYPFMDEVITDCDYWVDLYLSKLEIGTFFKEEALPENDQQEEMMKWMENINQLPKNI